MAGLKTTGKKEMSGGSVGEVTDERYGGGGGEAKKPTARYGIFHKRLANL